MAWSAAAQTGLKNLKVGPLVEQVIIKFVNNWATNAAPGWKIGVPHQYKSNLPKYVATAQLDRVQKKDRLVSITNFV